MPESTTIDDVDVYWPKGRTDPEIIFHEELALARLIAEEQVFCNSFWWKEDWPEEARKVVSLNVNCNDIFAWGCADAEGMLHDDIKDVYDHWLKDPRMGTAVWCCKRRKMMPQKPVADSIRKAGIWDLDSMGLEENGYDKFLRERKEKKEQQPDGL